MRGNCWWKEKTLNEDDCLLSRPQSGDSLIGLWAHLAVVSALNWWLKKNHERLPLIPSQPFRSSAAERFKTLTKPLATKVTENYKKNMPLATPSKSFHDQVQTQNFLNIIFIHTCYELIIFSCLHMLSFLSEHICLFCLFHISEPVRTRRNSSLNVLLPHSRQADDYRP